MTPQLAIVTGTRHRTASLRRFVDSIFRTATVNTAIVIADASDVFDPNIFRYSATGEITSIIHYHESPRLGPNKGYNVAFRRAAELKPRFVAFMNDDCECVPGWDRTAIDYMDRFPEIGLGALYFSMDGATGYYCQSFQNLLYANMGVYRREVGELVGWFDEREVYMPELRRMERIKMYGNDTAASFKVIDAGYAVVPIPGTKVIHHREQDEVRQENNREHVHGPRGNIAGQIIWQLWNGDVKRQAEEGHEYGYRRLREKHSQFSYLPKDIYLKEE